MQSVVIIAAITVSIVVSAWALPQGGKQYPLKLQPELDNIDVEDYLKNERLLDLQIKCVVYDGPCDAVGRWVKPRVAAALLGNCLECTPKQTIDMQKILAHIQEKRPAAYRDSVVKYLNESGIAVPGSNTTTTTTAKP